MKQQQSMDRSLMTGRIFQIQKFSLHDGPGIRTTFFLKGCHNRCSWCHNPESIAVSQSIEWFPEQCIGCGECAAVCTTGARIFTADGPEFDRARCTGCGQCFPVCFSGAIKPTGRDISLEDALEEALRDRIYYEKSGGGVTLSGGEPFMQPEFTMNFLRILQEQGIHTTVQTAGAFPYAVLKEALPWIDLVMFDLKGFSNEVYRNHVGGSRRQVYSTLEQLLAEPEVEIAVRTPLVGGVNDTEEEIAAIAQWLGEHAERLVYYQLVPYHKLGIDKYTRLGASYVHDFYTPEPDVIRRFEEIAGHYVPMRRNNNEQ